MEKEVVTSSTSINPESGRGGVEEERMEEGVEVGEEEAMVSCSICCISFPLKDEPIILEGSPETNWKAILFRVLCTHLKLKDFFSQISETNVLEKTMSVFRLCRECIDYGWRLVLLDQSLLSVITEINELAQSFRTIISTSPTTGLDGGGDRDGHKYIQDFKARVTESLPVNEPASDACLTRTETVEPEPAVDSEPSNVQAIIDDQGCVNFDLMDNENYVLEFHDVSNSEYEEDYQVQEVQEESQESILVQEMQKESQESILVNGVDDYQMQEVQKESQESILVNGVDDYQVEVDEEVLYASSGPISPSPPYSPLSAASVVGDNSEDTFKAGHMTSHELLDDFYRDDLFILKGCNGRNDISLVQAPCFDQHNKRAAGQSKKASKAGLKEISKPNGIKKVKVKKSNVEKATVTKMKEANVEKKSTITKMKKAKMPQASEASSIVIRKTKTKIANTKTGLKFDKIILDSLPSVDVEGYKTMMAIGIPFKRVEVHVKNLKIPENPMTLHYDDLFDITISPKPKGNPTFAHKYNTRKKNAHVPDLCKTKKQDLTSPSATTDVIMDVQKSINREREISIASTLSIPCPQQVVEIEINQCFEPLPNVIDCVEEHQNESREDNCSYMELTPLTSDTGEETTLMNPTDFPDTLPTITDTDLPVDVQLQNQPRPIGYQTEANFDPASSQLELEENMDPDGPPHLSRIDDYLPRIDRMDCSPPTLLLTTNSDKNASPPNLVAYNKNITPTYS